MNEPIRVIVLKDSGVFVAQCLEVDIAAQGKTEAEALSRLRVAFNAEVAEAKEQGKSVMSIGPAPGHIHALYNSEVVMRTKLAA